MHLNNNLTYKKLFSLTNAQITTLEDLVNSEPEESWDKNTYRQDRKKGKGVHQFTKSLILKFNFKDNNDSQKPWANTNFLDQSFIDRYKIITELFEEAAKALNISKYKVDRYIIVKLPAGKEVLKHKDNPMPFAYSHRIHVPIITNNECIFTVNNEKVPMDIGYAIEINNLLPHSVNNKSTTEDRVHLIFDIKEDLS